MDTYFDLSGWSSLCRGRTEHASGYSQVGSPHAAKLLAAVDSSQVEVDVGDGQLSDYASARNERRGCFSRLAHSVREGLKLSKRRKEQAQHAKFVCELVFLVMTLYYVDMALDVKALVSFMHLQQYSFFCINLGAILLSWLLTFSDLIRIGDHDFKVSYGESLLLGFSYPLQLHMVYLTYLCIKAGKKHPVLISAKFAEASIEAVISALVQLYSLCFCSEAIAASNCVIEGDNQFWLAVSVASSLVSIGAAFSVFDMRSYGLAGLPGSLTTYLDPLYLCVVLFRTSEITSRLTSLAAFQLVTRPYGGWLCMTLDAAIMVALIWRNGGMARYCIPCMFGLVNPMLEKEGVVTLPHRRYYLVRVVELLLMVLVAAGYSGGFQPLLNTFDYEVGAWLLRVLLASTVAWLVLLPIIRRKSKNSIETYSEEDWANAPFGALQMSLRDAFFQASDTKPDGGTERAVVEGSEVAAAAPAAAPAPQPEEGAEPSLLAAHLEKALKRFEAQALVGDDVNLMDVERQVAALLCLGHNCLVGKRGPYNGEMERRLWKQLSRALQEVRLVSTVVLQHEKGPFLLTEFLMGADGEDLDFLKEVVTKLLESAGTLAAERLSDVGGFRDHLVRKLKEKDFTTGANIEEQWATMRQEHDYATLVALLMALVLKRPCPDLQKVTPNVWFDFFSQLFELSDPQLSTGVLPWFPMAADCDMHKVTLQRALETLLEFFFRAMDTRSVDDDRFVMRKLLDFCSAIEDVEAFQESSIAGTWHWTDAENLENRVQIESAGKSYVMQALQSKEGTWTPVQEPLEGQYRVGRLVASSASMEDLESNQAPAKQCTGKRTCTTIAAESVKIYSVAQVQVNYLDANDFDVKLRGGSSGPVYVESVMPAKNVILEALRPSKFESEERAPFRIWVTMGAPKLKKTTGKYYYEVKFGEGLNNPQVGWVTENFKRGPHSGSGVGDDEHGWAADGLRGAKWHKGTEENAWPEPWQSGSVVGCAIDLDAGKMQFAHKGTWFAAAEFTFEARGRAFFPAASIRGDFTFVFAASAFTFAPPEGGYKALLEPESGPGTFPRPKAAFEGGKGPALANGVEAGYRLKKKGDDCCEFEKLAPSEILAVATPLVFESEALSSKQVAAATAAGHKLFYKAELRAGEKVWFQDVWQEGITVRIGSDGPGAVSGIRVGGLNINLDTREVLQKLSPASRAPVLPLNDEDWWQSTIKGEKVKLYYVPAADELMLETAPLLPEAMTKCKRQGTVSFKTIVQGLEVVIKKAKVAQEKEVQDSAEVLEQILVPIPPQSNVRTEVLLRHALRRLRRTHRQLGGGKDSQDAEHRQERNAVYEQRAKELIFMVVKEVAQLMSMDLTLANGALMVLRDWMTVEQCAHDCCQSTDFHKLLAVATKCASRSSMVARLLEHVSAILQSCFAVWEMLKKEEQAWLKEYASLVDAEFPREQMRAEVLSLCSLVCSKQGKSADPAAVGCAAAVQLFKDWGDLARRFLLRFLRVAEPDPAVLKLIIQSYTELGGNAEWRGDALEYMNKCVKKMPERVADVVLFGKRRIDMKDVTPEEKTQLEGMIKDAKPVGESIEDFHFTTVVKLEKLGLYELLERYKKPLLLFLNTTW